MTACLRALRLVCEALTAVCVVATVLAAAQGSPLWALVFGVLAVAAFEATSP